MRRNEYFHPLREPLRADESLQLHHASGPFAFLNPTRAYYNYSVVPETQAYELKDEASKSSHTDDDQPASHIGFDWRSRNNRKGRHALTISPSSLSSAVYLTPKPSSNYGQIAKGITRMFTLFPYWDVSYLVAVTFTWGSLIWVLNAFFVYLPLAQPQTEFKDEILVAGGVTAFLGATVFEVGSVLLMLEAVNENKAGCFGWALAKMIHGPVDHRGKYKVQPDLGVCVHHHANEKNLIGQQKVTMLPSKHSSDPANAEQGNGWTWFPSLHDLKSHYLYEIGFLACFFQFCGATIFWISGFTALPGINDRLSQGLLDGIYWIPQIVGGAGFIISSILFMLETQSKWYLPAPSMLGWHIGLWNLVGALGFTLCGALGPAYYSSGAEYEASLATLWGSWAFLIGSVIQWYESLDKHPVEKAAVQ